MEPEIKLILEKLGNNISKMNNISGGIFGSIGYNNPSFNSDYDIMLVVDDIDNSIDINVIHKLLNVDKSKNIKDFTLFKEQDLRDFNENRVQILQSNGIINISDIGLKGQNIEDINFDVYIISKKNLYNICASEPGGQVFQRYNSRPQKKSIMPYEFYTTSGRIIPYNQNIMLIDESNNFIHLNDLLKDEKSLNKIYEFERYQKLSPGLIRMSELAELYDESMVDNSILIGTTGDKVLTMSMLHDPLNIAEEILVPSWERVSIDFKLNDNNFIDGFASILNRYKLGKFNEKTIEFFNDRYDKSTTGKLRYENLMVNF